MISEQDDIKVKLERILEVFISSACEIRPHFILTGPSGSGKSHIIKKLAENASANFMELNAAQLTKEGMSGNSLSKALSPLLISAGRPTICFVDEFDKLFISGNNGEQAHEVTTGVQNEFLRVLEAEKTSVFHNYGKYVETDVGNVLFVFAGAFNGIEDIDIDTLRDFGVKTEFLGRVPLVFNLEKLSLESLRFVLDKSELFEKYCELFDINSEKAETIKSEIMEIVEETYDNNTLGIRLLNALINQYFINDGKIQKTEAKKVAFKKKLRLAPQV